jgi:hypothetical protein
LTLRNKRLLPLRAAGIQLSRHAESQQPTGSLQELNVDLFERKGEGCGEGKRLLQNIIANQCLHKKGPKLQIKAKQMNLLKKKNENKRAKGKS